MTTPERPQQRKARHLIDFDAPRSRHDSAAAEKRLSTVQKWVLSTLAATTVLHLSVGIVIAAFFLDRGRAEQLLLCAIAAAFGVLALAVARAIHQVRIPSPWLLAGTVPAIVGAVLILQ